MARSSRSSSLTTKPDPVNTTKPTSTKPTQITHSHVYYTASPTKVRALPPGSGHGTPTLPSPIKPEHNHSLTSLESKPLLTQAYKNMNNRERDEFVPEYSDVLFPREGFHHIQNTTLDGENVYMKAREKSEQAAANKEANKMGDPVPSLRDKWRLLPHFLQLRGLMRQHIDSFNHFVTTEIKKIVKSPSASEIRSDNDPNFFLRYTDCWVGEPNVQDDR